MFRRLIPLLLVAGCAIPPSPATQAPPPVIRSAQQAVDAYIRVSRRIEPVAESLCRQKNPAAPRNYCDILIREDARTDQPPNAFQTIGKDGRPIIAFNVPMVATVRNDDEIAFILGHEAGHQIRNHLVKSNINANLGAVLLGSISAITGASPTQIADAERLGGTLGARAYSKSNELEADEVGSYVAYLTGYDPLVGARSFARFAGGSGFLSTHPDTGQRLTIVQRTVARINAQQAAGLPVVLP